MTVQIIAFALGCGLIVIAILGGGIEVKELKVPPLSAVPRVLSAMFGLVLMLGAAGGAESVGKWMVAPPPGNDSAALGNSASNEQVPAKPQTPSGSTATAGKQPARDRPSSNGQESTPPVPASSAHARTIVVTDRLGPRQEYERIQVFVRGQQVAVLSIDAHQRTQSFPLEVEEGDQYTLTGTEASRDEDGVVRVRTVRGSGSFQLTDRTDYSVLQVGRKTSEVTTYELKPKTR